MPKQKNLPITKYKIFRIATSCPSYCVHLSPTATRCSDFPHILSFLLGLCYYYSLILYIILYIIILLFIKKNVFENIFLGKIFLSKILAMILAGSPISSATSSPLQGRLPPSLSTTNISFLSCSQEQLIEQIVSRKFIEVSW